MVFSPYLVFLVDVHWNREHHSKRYSKSYLMVVIQLGRQHSFAEFLINGVFYAKEEEFFSQATSRRPIFDWHLQFSIFCMSAWIYPQKQYILVRCSKKNSKADLCSLMQNICWLNYLCLVTKNYCPLKHTLGCQAL